MRTPKDVLVLLVTTGACAPVVDSPKPASPAAPAGSALTAPTERAFTLRGHVVDPKHVPVADAYVALSSPDEVEAHTATSHDGAFSFSVHAGTWNLSAQAPALCGSFVDGLRIAADAEVELSLGTAAAGVEITVHVAHDAPLPRGAGLLISRLSEANGDVWYAPIDQAADTARVIVPSAKQYFANGLDDLEGHIDITDAAHPPVMRVDTRSAPSDDVVAAVRDHAIRIASVDPHRGNLSDLEPFGELVGDTPVVAIGEATHGTREFFQLKHRLFKYLVMDKGFTTLAFEADQAECRAIERYIQGGPGLAPALVEAMELWMWRTDELIDLVLWMRAYNEQARALGRAPIHFVGFDMQSFVPARDELMRFLERVDPRAAKALALGLAPLDVPWKWPGDLLAQLSPAGQAAIQRALADAGRAVEAHHDDPGYDDAARDASSLRQWQAVALETGDATRDAFMAENLRAIRKTANTKMMIWAHNYHVGRYGEAAMGALLQHAWGKDYLPVGVVFGGGEFRAIATRPDGSDDDDFATQTIGPPEPYDAVSPFVATSAPLLALDLRVLPAAADRWFTAEHRIRETGWAFTSERHMTRSGVLRDRFDALLFVAHSTASRYRDQVLRGG